MLGFTAQQLTKYIHTPLHDRRDQYTTPSEAFELINLSYNKGQNPPGQDRPSDNPDFVSIYKRVKETYPGDMTDELYYAKLGRKNPQGTTNLHADQLPNFGGEQNVIVKASNLGHKSSITAAPGASSHDVLAIVPIGNQPYGTTINYEVQDAALHVILNPLGFGKDGGLSSSDSDIINENTFEVCDMKNRTLYIPSNHHVHINCKLLHKRHTGL